MIVVHTLELSPYIKKQIIVSEREKIREKVVTCLWRKK